MHEIMLREKKIDFLLKQQKIIDGHIRSAERFLSRREFAIPKKDKIPFRRTSSPLAKRRQSVIINPNYKRCYEAFSKHLDEPPISIKIRGTSTPIKGIISGHLALKPIEPQHQEEDEEERITSGERNSFIKDKLLSFLTKQISKFSLTPGRNRPKAESAPSPKKKNCACLTFKFKCSCSHTKNTYVNYQNDTFNIFSPTIDDLYMLNKNIINR